MCSLSVFVLIVTSQMYVTTHLVEGVQTFAHDYVFSEAGENIPAKQ